MPDTPNEPEKIDIASLDIAALKREELLSLFPEVRTEGGKIDFDLLKAALGEMVDTGRERYGMNWPGKAECMRTIQAILNYVHLINILATLPRSSKHT